MPTKLDPKELEQKTKERIVNNIIGKPVAIRGRGSGVNVGICAGIHKDNILLEGGSFFLRKWEYKYAHGAFHSLGNADVHDGEITPIKQESIITDAVQIVLCPDKIMDKLKKIAVYPDGESW